MRRKLLRADKKKVKSLAGATRRCRLRKKREKAESQSVKADAGPFLYDNLMRIVILATCNPLADSVTCLVASSPTRY